MRSASGPYPFDRCVSPRRPITDTRYIIAVDDESVLVERTGEIHARADLALVLLTEPSSILVCERAVGVLVELDKSWAADVAGWQFRVSPVVRRVYRQHRRKRPTETREVIVAFLGWRVGNRRTHYHYPLDPFVYTGKPVRELVPVGAAPHKLSALMQWAQDVREWCQKHELKVGPATGSIGIQLLKDPRFYPDRRRKVPMATNEVARRRLPGNFYRLYCNPRTYHEAYYIDLSAAHHHVASTLLFPSANGLFARGRFRNPPESVSGKRAWVLPGSAAFESLLRSHGLLLARIESPANVVLKGSFVPPYMEKPGLSLAWIYTNEVPFIRELGGIIEGIDAAWTSYEHDPGLNKYADWALTETDGMADSRKRWAKPTMLAAYGMLAARPVQREYGYHHTVQGEEFTYMTSGGPLTVQRRQQEKLTEAPVVNVIHRGMIEAQVRLQALRLARQLHEAGTKVLCVYADSVIVDSTGSVPLIPDPWRIKSPLSRLEFFNPTSFHSVEMTRLPGIPAEGRARIARVRSIRALNRDTMRGDKAVAPE